MATIRNNVVLIKSDFIETVEVDKGSLYATQGQPTDQNIKVDYSNNILSILVRSGRKKSSPVAERFITESEGNMLPSTWGFSGSPEELNFTFNIIIKWKNGEESKVVLGQGSTAALRNNWWIGSPNMSGSNIKAGRDSLRVFPDSVKEDFKKIDKVAKDRIPAQFHGLYDLVGHNIFKELLKDVNVFGIDKS